MRWFLGTMAALIIAIAIYLGLAASSLATLAAAARAGHADGRPAADTRDSPSSVSAARGPVGSAAKACSQAAVAPFGSLALSSAAPFRNNASAAAGLPAWISAKRPNRSAAPRKSPA